MQEHSESPRRVLVLAHTGRNDALKAALETCKALDAAGIVPVMRDRDLDDVENAFGKLPFPVETLPSHGDSAGSDRSGLGNIDLGMVLGGDGTILRAAEYVRGHGIPLLGVNLGHVGFLAESERSDLAETVARVVARDYTVEERMSIDVKVWFEDQLIYHTWALNEAAVEKADRERMLEVAVEVDARPISAFGCDGIVMATPTGSTAYSFSAGGPVVWPEVEALLLTPISAHALFTKPLVVAPTSVLAVELVNRTDTPGVLWCDGRRPFDIPSGARVEVTRSPEPVRLVRLNDTPFAERLVRKFELPTQGWRGPTKAELGAQEGA